MVMAVPAVAIASGEASMPQPLPSQSAKEEDQIPLAQGEISGGAEQWPGYGSLPAPQTRPSWRDWSDPWFLLLRTAAEVGQLVLTLLSIVWIVWKRGQFCMYCQGRPFWLACLCSYTQTYVRLFPVMAVVISLVVASRTLLQRHFFYQMLKHGLLVRLETRTAVQDPLFYFLVWCLAHVLGHLALDISTPEAGQTITVLDMQSLGQRPEGALENEVMEEIKSFAFYYMAPAVVFMCFLWASYDTEMTLLPLSKYMEGDTEAAGEKLSLVSIISESDARQAAEIGVTFESFDGAPYEVKDLCFELAQGVRDLAAIREEESDSSSAKQGPPLSIFAKTWWIAELMVDRDLKDKDSKAFRNVWYVYSVISLLLISFVVGVFAYSIHGNISHAFGELREYERLCGMGAGLLHVCVTSFVGHGFISTLWRPLRDEARHHANKVGQNFQREGAMAQ